ncbi:MAG TPA: DUF1616 domain-containing protein [Solirubrobacterales bacterium]|nr:DUF1616 domain-containing protein [Solirubrobacterales bacterium]
MRGNRDLQVAVRAAVACAVLAIVLPTEVLSLIAAAPLVFFLPGYTIVCAVFARRRIDPPRLLVLSFGLSLAVLALLPLLLDLLPGGISTGWWAVSLCLVVLGAARAAALGRRKPARAVFRRPRLSLAKPEAGLLAVGLLAGIAAVVLVFIPVSSKNALGYSELWIEPRSGEVPSVLVGVASREQEEDRFTMEARTNLSDIPFEITSFELGPGEERELVVEPPVAGEQPVKISVTLFREGISQPYRRVAAWTPEPPR